MPLIVQSQMQIGKLFFDYTGGVDIDSNWRNLTDTCTIRLPRNLKTQGGLYLRDAVETNNEVVIKLGYSKYGLSQRFKGYVTGFNADTTVAVINCEDEMWNLKQTAKMNASYKDGDLETIIKAIRQKAGANWQYELLGDKVSLGQVKFEALSGAKILQKLKDDYGIYSFFRNGVLTVGKPYNPDSSKRQRRLFAYGVNMIDMSDLEFKRKKDVRIKVKMVNHKADGKKEEYTTGDEDGEERTLDFYNRKLSDLKLEAGTWLDKLKYDGYRGSFEAFGEPRVNHGDVAVIRDWRFPDREGEYFIDAVETTGTVKTIRQKITLGPKAK